MSMTSTEYRTEVLSKLQTAKTLVCAGDYEGIIRLFSGSYQRDLWAAAMTAHYGPTDLRLAYCCADGRPTPETLARFPSVARCMADARLNVVRLIGWYERYV